MNWFLNVFRMLVGRTEPPVSDGNASVSRFSRFRRQRQEMPEDVREKLVIELPPIDGPCTLDILPNELIAKVGSYLEFEDTVSFRQSCQRMNRVHQNFRSEMKGADIHVFVTVVDGEVVTSFRGHKEIKKREPRLVPRNMRNMIFRNADVTLTLSLRNSEVTQGNSTEIFGAFERCKLSRVQLKATRVTQILKALLNQMDTSSVEVHIQRLEKDDSVTDIAKLNDLKIDKELLFFQLKPIFDLHIPTLSVRVTDAARPSLLACIEEWKQSRRHIAAWFFTLPFLQFRLNPGLDNAEIDWRRTIIRRHDRSCRLMSNTRQCAPEPGDQFLYRTVCYYII
ncbi:hypothetical protein L3Y34_008032 [Caenorhabditis briggsae]|uniref:F-box domain-containing protein n=2 Tax=Caenorhabditis briggsae TaxID=6238 RepID=A0AAE9A3M5_CAEBR|nr:hypothetical protein L3Y34_008032 [Caenorhabditis briggsae]